MSAIGDIFINKSYHSHCMALYFIALQCLVGINLLSRIFTDLCVALQTLSLMRHRLGDSIHIEEYIVGKSLLLSYWRFAACCLFLHLLCVVF